MSLTSIIEMFSMDYSSREVYSMTLYTEVTTMHDVNNAPLNAMGGKWMKEGPC